MRQFALKVVAMTLIFAGAAQANSVDLGTYSVDFVSTPHLSVSWLDGFGGNYFSLGGDTSDVSGNPNADVQIVGNVAANFHAQSGKVFDKLYFVGTTTIYAINEAGGVNSKLDWTVPGQTFVGETTYGGFQNPPGRSSYVNYWEVTGPSTGTAVLGRNDVWNVSSWIDGIAGSGYYDIGVADFSINVDSLVTITAGLNSNGVGYSQWASGFRGVPGVIFAVSFRDAPPITAAVPEPKTYGMMLMGLALMGFMFRRRQNKEA